MSHGQKVPGAGGAGARGPANAGSAGGSENTPKSMQVQHSERVSARIFVAGAVLMPIRGTIRWGDEGSHLGLWGDRDNPVVPHILEADGQVRPANPAEHRMIDKLYPWGRP